MGTGEFKSLKWDELDDSFGMIDVSDTGEFDGVVKFADDAFYDGIDYVSPAQRLESESMLDNVVFTDDIVEDDMPVYQPLDDTPSVQYVQQDPVSIVPATKYTQLATTPKEKQVKTGTPRHAKEIRIDDEDDDGDSWAGIIIAIVLALVVLGGLVWFFFGAGGCSAFTNDPGTSQEITDNDNKDNPSDDQQQTPVTPEQEPEKEPETEPEKEPETDPEKEPETDPQRDPVTPEQEPEQQPEQQPETEPEQPQTKQVWVPEEGHLETKQNWVTDTPAWDEPVYETRPVQVDTIHHDAEGYVDIVPAWDEEVTDEEGNVIETIHHEATEEWVETSPEWDEPVYEDQEVQVDTIHHEEVGHFEPEQYWVTDVPGHWEEVPV